MTGKVSKRSVRYRRAWLVDRLVDRTCGDCTMFRAPGSCTLVEGRIAPAGVCVRFERKGKAR